MRRARMPDIREGNVNVTPLIDIVMCLIIFFMLVAKIGVNTGADETIDIPASILGKELKELQGNSVVLNVRQLAGSSEEPVVTGLVGGSLRSPVEIKLLDPGTDKHPLREVLQRLKIGADGKPNPNFAVIIRGEQSMQYRCLEQVLIEVAGAGVQNVNFSTKKVTEVQ